MKLKKRNKRSRIRGRRTCGYSAKLHKGSGSRGGKGMAGTGKRADQKKTLILKIPGYFGRPRSRKKTYKKKKYDIINLEDIDEKIDSLINRGVAKKTPEGIEINLAGYKILGGGKTENKLIIRALSASKSAKKQIEEKGGKVIIKSKIKANNKETKEKVIKKEEHE